jgi:hypothetical protein
MKEYNEQALSQSVHNVTQFHWCDCDPDFGMSLVIGSNRDDTIWLEEDHWDDMSEAFRATEPEHVKTDNIKSLAKSSYTFWSFGAKHLLGAKRRHFRGIEELIILIDDEANLTEYIAKVDDSVRALQEQNPKFRYPVVNIMTERMLTDKFL